MRIRRTRLGGTPGRDASFPGRSASRCSSSASSSCSATSFPFRATTSGRLVPQRSLAGVPVSQDAGSYYAVTVTLTAATDPADRMFASLHAKPGYRLVHFALSIENRTGYPLDVYRDNFRLKVHGGHTGGCAAPTGRRTRSSPPGCRPASTSQADVVFELPDGTMPAEASLRRLPFLLGHGRRRFRFHSVLS